MLTSLFSSIYQRWTIEKGGKKGGEGKTDPGGRRKGEGRKELQDYPTNISDRVLIMTRNDVKEKRKRRKKEVRRLTKTHHLLYQKDFGLHSTSPSEKRKRTCMGLVQGALRGGGKKRWEKGHDAPSSIEIKRKKKKEKRGEGRGTKRQPALGHYHEFTSAIPLKQCRQKKGGGGGGGLVFCWGWWWLWGGWGGGVFVFSHTQREKKREENNSYETLSLQRGGIQAQKKTASSSLFLLRLSEKERKRREKRRS